MKCGCNPHYRCSDCGQCYYHKHQFVERADGWWTRCPTLKWKRTVFDAGSQ